MAANEVDESSVRWKRELGRWTFVASVAFLILSVALVVGLDKGDKLASIGSFVFCLLNALVSGWATSSTRRAGEPGEDAGSAEFQYLKDDAQAAGRDARRSGGNYYEYSGISLTEHTSIVDNLKADIAKLGVKLDHADGACRRLEGRLSGILRAGIVILLLAVVSGVFAGRQWVDSSSAATSPIGQSKPPARPTTTPSIAVAADVALENQVNKFFADFYAESRNGGFSNVEVIRRYFAPSFKWYSNEYNDAQAFADERKAKGQPRLDGCRKLATVAANVNEKDGNVVANAVVVWARPNGQQGIINVNYTLKRESTGEPFRISTVAEPKEQTGC